MKKFRRSKVHWLVSFVPYGSRDGKSVDAIDRPNTKKEAEELAKRLRSNGHTKVVVHSN